jgi:hypothetical protein
MSGQTWNRPRWGRVAWARLGWHRPAWGLQITVARTVVVLAPGAFLGIAHLAGGRLSPAWLLVAGLGLACARWPDTDVPLGGSAVLGIAWIVAVPGFSWLALPASFVGLAGHCACAFVAGAPDDAAVDRTLARLWAWRLAIVAAVTCVVAVLGCVVSVASPAGSVVFTALTLVAIGGWVLVQNRLAGPGPDAGPGGGPDRVGRV